MMKWFFVLLFSLSIHQSFAQPKFPLRYSASRRYFEDRNGTPFLYNAETGWQLTYKLTLEEAREYMALRKAQGFNTLQIQLAMEVGAKNRYGAAAFDGNTDFSKPNEPYHDHVLRLINLADSFNLLVVLSQPWLGCCREAFGGGPDKPIQQNGPLKNRQYGQYLGKKFASCKNLFWIIGGDNDPKGERAELMAFAEGLRSTAPSFQLLTYHASPPHSSTDLFQYAPWLGFSMVYTYWRDKPSDWVNPDQLPEVYEVCLREYNKSDVMPFVLGEAQYEGTTGNDIGTPHQVRRQAYWTMLCGGAGAAYGSEIYTFPQHWRTIINNTGAAQLKHFYVFFSTLPWWRLVPDQRHQLVIAGYGTYSKPAYVTTAVADDKRTAVSYFPERQTIVADLSKLEGEAIGASWFNPRTGEATTIGVFKKAKEAFTPPTNEDWVLLLQSK